MTDLHEKVHSIDQQLFLLKLSADSSLQDDVSKMMDMITKIKKEYASTNPNFLSVLSSIKQVVSLCWLIRLTSNSQSVRDMIGEINKNSTGVYDELLRNIK